MVCVISKSCVVWLNLLYCHLGYNFSICHKGELRWQAWFTGEKRVKLKTRIKGRCTSHCLLFGVEWNRSVGVRVQ